MPAKCRVRLVVLRRTGRRRKESISSMQLASARAAVLHRSFAFVAKGAEHEGDETRRDLQVRHGTTHGTVYRP